MRFITLFMLAIFVLSVSFSQGAQAAMPCCEGMSKEAQAAMPCHDKEQKKVPAKQYSGCNDCACLHCPTTAGVLLPEAMLTQHTLSLSYFVLPKSLNSRADDVFYPPPKSHS